MRFYIIGSNVESFKVSPRSAGTMHLNLEDALNDYTEAVAECRYNHIYFVADFKNYKRSLFFNKLRDGFLPFFIIGEYHYNREDPHKYLIRDDKTIVTTGGFAHEFSNNLKAVKEYVFQCKNSKKPVQFDIMYGGVVKHHDGIITPTTIRETVAKSGFHHSAYCNRMYLRAITTGKVELKQQEFKMYSLKQEEDIIEIKRRLVR